MLKKLQEKDLQPNTPVEWPIYSASGQLLLHPGQTFLSEQLIEVLLWRGLFRGNKCTFGSNEYEEVVEIKHEELAEYETEKERENFNDEFSALANKQSENNSLFQSDESEVFSADSETKFGDDFNINDESDIENDSSNQKNFSLTENQHQNLVNTIKSDVLKTVRSELDYFLKNCFREQIQLAIKKETRQEIQQNVVSQLGRRIDGKIKKEVNSFLESEYGRDNNPIKKLIDISSHLDLIYEGLVERSPESESAIVSIASEIQELCVEYPDAMLMSIHLYNRGSYTIRHPIDMAILCELISLRRGIKDKSHRQYIIAAALTCDFSMREMQKTLQTQRAPLDEAQREKINFHTVQSVAVLLSAGVMEPIWLDTVAQHHERIDGSGYPLQYKGEQICEGAKILAISDRYSAMVTGRSYRTALHGKDALSAFLSEEESVYDENIVISLIHELNIYPPGTFVQLKNGEYAVVTHRGENKTKQSKIQPRVISFANADGTNIDPPVVRDCKIKKYSVKETIFWEKQFLLTPEKIWELSAETK